MKKIVFVLTLLLALGMSAAMAEVSGDFEYRVNNGTAVITGYTGNATSLTIPEALNGVKVTSISNYAFQNCHSLIRVNIPDSIIDIDEFVFSGCHSLNSINIPDGITIIRDYTFYDCPSLTSINIPKSVTTIGECAFCFCDSLTSVTIPDSVRTISDYAFANCASLTSVVIPDSVTSIRDNAFEDCPSLTLAVTPDSYAEKYAIDNNISYVHAAEPEISAGDWEYRLLDDGTAEITKYLGAEPHVLIPVAIQGHRVTSIADKAFENRTDLTHVLIPYYVTSIGTDAFKGCPQIDLLVVSGSYAEQYVAVNRIRYIRFYPWTCSCGTINTGDTCPFCGEAWPKADVQCSFCGYQPEGSPKFCINCANPL